MFDYSYCTRDLTVNTCQSMNPLSGIALPSNCQLIKFTEIQQLGSARYIVKRLINIPTRTSCL